MTTAIYANTITAVLFKAKVLIVHSISLNSAIIPCDL